jgi:hypothetical protein
MLKKDSEGYLSFELGQLLKMGLKKGDCTSMNGKRPVSFSA